MVSNNATIAYNPTNNGNNFWFVFWTLTSSFSRLTDASLEKDFF